MRRQDERAVLQQILEIQLAAAHQVDGCLAGRSRYLESRLRQATGCRVRSSSADDLDELIEVRQVVGEWCACEDVGQIEFISSDEVELLRVCAAALDHQGMGRNDTRSSRARCRLCASSLQ